MYHTKHKMANLLVIYEHFRFNLIKKIPLDWTYLANCKKKTGKYYIHIPAQNLRYCTVINIWGICSLSTVC